MTRMYTVGSAWPFNSVLIIFVDISCYYMKQGGFIMTCQRALCANNDEKDDIEKDSGEKVPLNQESGSLDGKNDKNANSVNITKVSHNLWLIIYSSKNMNPFWMQFNLNFRTRNKKSLRKKFQKFKNSPKSDPAGVGAITKAAGLNL